jgi:malonyl-ACP decarboxylase
MNRVLVTGLGVVSSIGLGPEAFCAALKAGKSGIRSISQQDSEHGLRINIAALLNDFDFNREIEALDGLPQELLERAMVVARRAPLSIQASTLSALQAWKQAGLMTRPADPLRTGVIVGGHNISQRYAYEMHEAHGENLDYIPPNYGLQFMDSTQVGVLSELFQIRGEGFTVGGASASGNVGLVQGCRMIQWGVVDVCLVVGALSDVSPMELKAWDNMGAMGGKMIQCPESACRPFDQQHDGFIYGQGCGCLILESEASARSRSAQPLAEIAGAAMCLDGNRLSNPSREGEARVMAQALTRACMLPSDVQYLNTHGTASVLGDDIELAAIADVFSESVSQLWINSTKSLIGHCIYAAGAIEAVATIMQLNHGFVHPNPNLDNPIGDGLRFVGKESQLVEFDIAQSNSFGFGGFNTSIVFKRWHDAA